MLTPKLLINFSLLAAAALVAMVITVVSITPYTGFNLATDSAIDFSPEVCSAEIRGNSPSWVVTNAEPWIQSQGLENGDRISHISSPDGEEISLSWCHLPSAETKSAIKDLDRSERAKYFSVMHDALDGASTIVTLDDGSKIELNLSERRPLSSLPVKVWFELMMAVSAPLLSALVWAWQPRKPETILLLLSSMGFFFFVMASVLLFYDISMFYPPGWAFWLIRIGVDLGQCLFLGCGTCVLMFYPSRLPNASRWLKTILTTLFVFSIVALASSWKIENGFDQFLFFPDWAENVLMIVFPSLVPIFCYLQWRTSKSRPVERAQTLWVILCWTIGPAAYLFLYELPRQLDYGQFIPVQAANLLILMVYVLLMLGIARLNLFQLEQHIAVAYQWVLVTLLFVGLDIALIGFVNMSPQFSSLVVLLLVLWCYLPIRQKIHQNFFIKKQNHNQQLFNQVVVLMVRNSLDSLESARGTWAAGLNILFSPMNLAPIIGVKNSGLGERGAKLAVRANKYSPALELSYADSGSRLFSKNDIQLLGALELLYEQLYDFRDAYLVGQQEERNRIRRDLHDQIGHKLLSMIYAADNDKSRLLAQETMSQLSELIQALKEDAISCRELVTRLKTLFEEAADNSGLTVQWDESIAASDNSSLSSNQYLNILNIQRELLNNSIRHGNAKSITISVTADNDSLNISFKDDGIGFDQGEVKPGNGLFNIQSRVEELGASIRWDTTSGTQVILNTPLGSQRSNYE